MASVAAELRGGGGDLTAHLNVVLADLWRQASPRPYLFFFFFVFFFFFN